MKSFGLGRLGRDAEVRYTPGGDAVANLSIAFNYGPKDSDGNRPTQWVKASLWGKRAELLAQYLTKGSVHNFLLSDVHVETYEGQSGQGVNMVARVDDIELGPRSGDAGTGTTQRERPASGTSGQRPSAPKQNIDDMDDDIPF